jgi:TldD protein
MGRVTRREFLATGAKGVVLASIPGMFRFDPAAVYAASTGEVVNIKEYYEHFGVDEKMILDVMQTAMDRGGDYCDIYFQHSIANWVGLEDKAVNKAYSNVDFGVGIRVLSGDQTGFSFTEDISPGAMKLAAATAANIASGKKAVAPVKLELKNGGNYYPIETLWEKVNIDRKIPYLQKISLAARHGIKFFTRENVEKLADESVKRTIDLFEAIKPEAGEMEVVLAPGSSGILLHEAIGHGMEADFNRKNISIFADKINKPVAKEFVSIVDNGTNLNIRGSLNIDDEGNDTEETYLVKCTTGSAPNITNRGLPATAGGNRSVTPPCPG